MSYQGPDPGYLPTSATLLEDIWSLYTHSCEPLVSGRGTEAMGAGSEMELACVHSPLLALASSVWLTRNSLHHDRQNCNTAKLHHADGKHCLNYTVRSSSKRAIVLLNSVYNRSGFLFITHQGSNFRRYRQSNGATTNRTIRLPKDRSM